MRDKFNKIICVGWQKTGTTSLESMLELLGFTVCNFDSALISPAKQKEFRKLYRIAKKWDALSDVPWNVCFKELDTLFPGSKFILTLREESRWLQSVKNHFGDSTKESIKWLYNVEKPGQFPEILLQKYREHNESVLKYFRNRSADLYIHDWEKNGWEDLCLFLGLQAPRYRFTGEFVPIPQRNTSEMRKIKYDKKSAKLLKRIRVDLRMFLVRLFKFNIVYMMNYLKFFRKILNKYRMTMKFVK